jgi:hypothetical protein
LLLKNSHSLKQIQDELVQNTYQPMPMRKKEIPKDGGTKVRVLSIPTIRDRVVQGALKLILEPIFEADFQPGSYGYRPKRSAHEAVSRVEQAIVQGLTRILRGWLNYFRVGNSIGCFSYIKLWVEKKVRRHLLRARGRKGFGWKRWSTQWIYDTLGLFNDYRVVFAYHS